MCIIWLFSMGAEASVPKEFVVAILTLATQVAGQTMGMVKTATTAATMAATISVHMSSRPSNGGGGRKTREERWADQAAANKREQEASQEHARKSDERERRQNGGLTNREKNEQGAKKAEANRAKEMDHYIEKGRKTANQMQQKIERGSAPKGIKRIDKANTAVPGSKAHVHFDDGSAMNSDGTIRHNAKDGSPCKPNHKQARWLISHGWRVFGWMQRGAGFFLTGEAVMTHQEAFRDNWEEGEFESINWGWGNDKEEL
jgi:hypothetical protein